MRTNISRSLPSLFALAAVAVLAGTVNFAAAAAHLIQTGAAAKDGATPPAPGPGGKKKVTNADELPRHIYAISGTTLEILGDPARFNPILDQVLANALGDLEQYDISDPTTLRATYELIKQAHHLKGDLKSAIEWSDRAGALETKPEARARHGSVLRARAAALAVSGDPASPAFIAKFKEVLKQRLAAQPYELVKDYLIGVRSQAQMLTRELIESSLASSLDPLIENAKGKADQGLAEALLTGKETLDIGLPLLPHIAAVAGEIIDANAGAAVAASKWNGRLVELPESAKAAPVVVGIWDTGVDVDLFPKQLWTNPAEKPNGLDDDRNGFIDDIHGIAFDLDRRPATGPLCSLDGLKGDKSMYVDFVAASQDMQAGIQNDGVKRYQEHFAALRGDAMREFGEDMDLIGNYCHGTHVAGVAVTGNPFARILHVTENFPYKDIPDEAPTVEFGQRWGESCRQSVAYLKTADARVVNMSWRIGRGLVEEMLSAKGVGTTPEERAELSRRIFTPLREGLEQAIRSAPDVLFIAGSGNEDNNVDFAEYVPAGLRLPNLITVGAVDDQDRFTSFTTSGENVELYANGYRIPSKVPGGRVIPFSGTSMAAPQVANLAAKILALRPGLKPAEVVALMKANADPIPDKPGRFIINPKRTLEALEATPADAAQPDANATMKAVRMHDYGDASKLVFEDAPRPSPAAGELLVRVRAAGVNPVDWKIRSGMFRGGIDFAMPATLGFDIAGEVEAIGEGVTAFKKGDPVFAYLALNRGGGYAQFAIAKASEAARMPAGLDMANAGATPLVALTAWQALFDQGKLAKGQTVLIHGGAGGVGHMAVQLAKLKGAKVIATASADNRDFVKSLGADEVIDYRAVKFEDVVKDVDMVLDTVGGDTTNRSAAVLKRGGVLVTIAGEPNPKTFADRGARATDMLVEPNAGQLAQIAALIEAGTLKTHVGLQLPLKDAAAAHRRSEAGISRGKIVLVVD